METVLNYIITYGPVVLATLFEVLISKHAITTLSKAKETAEFKALVEQNKVLVEELRESKKLTKQLLTKIDRIERGES